jgi:3-dehydroquinate dehydratase/shikimate dehydrogenase
MTQICVSLTDETTDKVVERMRELSGVADLFEVRGDLVLDLDLLHILREKSDPVLFTLLAASEGGRWDDEAHEQRRRLLLEAVKRGYDYVDVPYRARYTEVIAEKAGRGLVLSYHDVSGAPDDLDALYEEMCDAGADIVKIAINPKSIADVGRLLAFAKRAKAKGGTPLVAIAMGPMGIVSRVLAGRYGAPFTFASASAGSEAAPGQLPAALLRDLYRAREIGDATKVYGVLGANVERSLSPVLHNRAFASAGLDAVYVPLQAEALEPFMRSVPDLELSGFSVTRPYKIEILSFLDEIDETAALCGSVNTVTVLEGRLQGSTSDGVGVLAPLRKRIDLKDKKVVVLGAGGAARAAAVALVKRGASVRVLARDRDKASIVAAAAGCSFGSLLDIDKYPFDVLINATPVGTRPRTDATPIAAASHRPQSVVFDMVYDPLETQFLRDAQAKGAKLIDGLEMLIAQAVVQFEAWTGRDAPVAEMKSAALVLAQGQEE